MKKLIGFFSSISLLLFLAACGQGDDNGETTPIDETGANQTEEQEDTEGDAVEDSDGTEEDAADEIGEKDEETTNEENEDTTMINSVTLFFADDQLMGTYRVETDLPVTADEAGAKQAYKLWVSGPTESNLVSLVPENTQIQSVEFNNGVAYVSFSEAILEANLGSSGELMLIEQIALIAEQFGYGKTQILVDGSVPSSFLGHMDVSEPIEAGNPAEYEKVN
ncbi:spore germination protein GerM [Evansella vedderi]|uniref:Spore germination protein GerM n=1 Tax=Evansella vedderi TaxID=38282 RepID=A0ABT9ZXZ0_9BACI|nr:GerMN domain-containing protein [Evansella vedderi]MDQ0256109.1 spore germination protein GerM [Evansella vedderi]